MRETLGALDAKASAEVFRGHVLPPVDPNLTGTGTDQLPLQRRPIVPGRDFLEVVDGPSEVVGRCPLPITERAHSVGRCAQWSDFVVTHGA